MHGLLPIRIDSLTMSLKPGRNICCHLPPFLAAAPSAIRSPSGLMNLAIRRVAARTRMSTMKAGWSPHATLRALGISSDKSDTGLRYCPCKRMGTWPRTKSRSGRVCASVAGVEQRDAEISPPMPVRPGSSISASSRSTSLWARKTSSSRSASSSSSRTGTGGMSRSILDSPASYAVATGGFEASTPSGSAPLVPAQPGCGPSGIACLAPGEGIPARGMLGRGSGRDSMSGPPELPAAPSPSKSRIISWYWPSGMV
mmetsp:Transcript_108523/g.346331  ORF Transcript_108523/g.346331 Transcript_108523/m.346331 type:complete len:256 (+) Transcript_108523:4707-5474(+)